jgi:hypothetical protein
MDRLNFNLKTYLLQYYVNHTIYINPLCTSTYVCYYENTQFPEVSSEH